MKYRKNQKLKSSCCNCGCKKVVVESVGRTKGSKTVVVWVKCPECGAVDDLIEEEY